MIGGDVELTAGGVVCIGAADVARLRERSHRSPRRRARICAHPSREDSLHEMIICLARETYIRPHRHAGKSESFHMIEGELDVVLFESDGRIREVIHLGPYPAARTFYYRLMEPSFHTVLVRTPEAVFHETTNGPFDPAETEFAPWAPEEGPAAEEYQHDLRQRTRA